MRKNSKSPNTAAVAVSPVDHMNLTSGYAAERIASLRRVCLERKKQRQPYWMPLSKEVLTAWESAADEPSRQRKRGGLTRYLLEHIRFDLDGQELLLGRLAEREITWSKEEDARIGEYLWREAKVNTPGQTGHCELEYDRIFELGVTGMRDDLIARLAKAEGKTADVYHSFLTSLQGFADMIENAAKLAEQAMPGAAPARREELSSMVACCRRIAHEPPASFRDGLQLLWFMVLAVTHGNQAGLVVPGHLDRTLGPLYANDIAAGKLTPEEALELIECLYLLINEYIPDGLAISVMVGGRDAQGRDVTNDVSYLCLEALRRTKLVYPTVGVCWHAGTPAALTALAVDLVSHGYSTPAFFGDDVIQKGLQSYGAPPAESCRYINSTCVEITPSGASNVYVASPYFPLGKLLLEEIDWLVENKIEPASFDSFVELYQARLAGRIAHEAALQNEWRRRRQADGGKPLQSLFTRSCLDRGLDIDDGGATYNWVECSFVGFANLVDSLHVIREELYGPQALSIVKLKEMLDANFAGFETERIRFLNAYPKYGNGNTAVDGLLNDMVKFVRSECVRHKMQPDGSPFVPGAFCWIMHERLGRECGATPDGRKAGFPFADGCGPAQGREKGGPTAAICSTTSWDHAPLIGGCAFNMKFSGGLFAGPEGKARLRDLVVTFLQRGGFETQINVVDYETLKQAKANPEAHRDLVVRIGGYTDYFTRLSPEMQEEVMLRTEYSKF